MGFPLIVLFPTWYVLLQALYNTDSVSNATLMISESTGRKACLGLVVFNVSSTNSMLSLDPNPLKIPITSLRFLISMCFISAGAILYA